jgi:hypothetical protein
MRNRHVSDLGSEAFKCRLMSGPEFFEDRVGKVAAWIIFYVILPLVYIPSFALMGTAVVCFVCDLSMKLLTGENAGPPILAAIPFGGFILLGCWFFFVWFNTRHLVLHEHGIRGKWPWRRFSVRFDDIDCLRIGRRQSWFTKAMYRFASLSSPGLSSKAAWLAENTIVLVLFSGRTINLGVPYQGFDQYDVNYLLSFLSTRVKVQIVR